MTIRASLRVAAVVALSTITLGLASTNAQASTTAAPSAVRPAATRCSDTVPPSWFYDIATNAAQADGSIPDSWGTDHNLARIVCFESSYQTGAVNGSYYGLGQMSKTNVVAYNVSWDNYLNGTAAHHIAYYQLLAALRYCKARYGSPAAGWAHEVSNNWW